MVNLLTPRDWQYVAVQEAIKMVGTPEYAAKMVEARRYGALADRIEHLQLQQRKTHQVGWYTPGGTLMQCDDPSAAKRYGWVPVFIDVHPSMVTHMDEAETEPGALQA